jgi:16S rRNA (uracil1498-N3)-methyltransferase
LNDERLEKKMTSWKKIITGACEQSQRNHIPLLQPPATLEELFSSETSALKILLHHHSDKPLGSHPAPESICLLVGPEGGFSEREADMAAAAGFEAVALGPRVLRTETAPLAALAVLQFHWGDMA